MNFYGLCISETLLPASVSPASKNIELGSCKSLTRSEFVYISFHFGTTRLANSSKLYLEYWLNWLRSSLENSFRLLGSLLWSKKAHKYTYTSNSIIPSEGCDSAIRNPAHFWPQLLGKLSGGRKISVLFAHFHGICGKERYLTSVTYIHRSGRMIFFIDPFFKNGGARTWSACHFFLC